jgi:hypothetical protein
MEHRSEKHDWGVLYHRLIEDIRFSCFGIFFCLGKSRG